MVSLEVVCLCLPASLTAIQRGKDNAIDRTAERHRLTQSIGKDRASYRTPVAQPGLRRTCARLCHLAGGELEQIQFLLGHASVQTNERYLGCKQKLSQAVNDKLGLEDT